MNKEIDGAWGLFRKKASPAGGFFMNLSTRQIELLKQVQEQRLDYSDSHAIDMIGTLSRMGLVRGRKGSPHEITEPGVTLLGLLGAHSIQQEPLKRAG